VSCIVVHCRSCRGLVWCRGVVTCRGPSWTSVLDQCRVLSCTVVFGRVRGQGVMLASLV
jgi:hypothetical protein